MNDIKRAAIARIRKEFDKAGLELRDGELADSPPVRLWLYSCSLDNTKAQPRLVAQATSDTYHQMMTRSGALGRLSINPADALGGCLAHFDKVGSDSAEDRQMLTAMIAYYMMNTQTWRDQARPLNQVAGIHAVVVDWKPKKGEGLMMRPLLLTTSGTVMNKEDIQAFMRLGMAHHFLNRPGDKPKGYGVTPGT